MSKLDKLIDNAKKVLKRRDKYRRWQTEDIFKTIYIDLLNSGYDYKSNDLLSYGLVKGRLDCDNYTLIYYAIAQEMGFPIYIINLPKHTTLLWDTDGRHDPLNKSNPVNEGDFYWETTLGEIRTDEQYIAARRIDTESIKSGVFLNKIRSENMYAVLHNYLAAGHIESNEFNKALDEINTAIKLDPKFPEAYNNKGIIHSNMKDFADAVKSYDKALSLHPNFTLAYINKGIALQKQGKYESAIKMYTDALTIESDFEPLYMMRAKLYKKIGLFDEALKDIKIYESFN
ncbi:MAG: tetratricopeptide repeat protein [Candidatus Dadabacteria bacterium]|nr:tetratricopeptide repeat protein [Candidatus Dadabacteria bacterium]NIS07644.1 tetratricopeptide repeat protein [Candidatus Dadabacteria bacterium]NIV42115.1 tetratricopeptide repeat protein [Candidatus Dadabacteria bacterium]NIX14739.1 tetratricopeptide repeat protein [Candidatus Dadabacteria bacterium]NIY21282.1 tetratricopeptide repeat protein [Candidatus Dadabacteria bacterium]